MNSGQALIAVNATLGILDIIVFTYSAFSFMSHVKENLFRPKGLYILGAILYAAILIIASCLSNIWLSMFLMLAATMIAGRCLYSSIRIQLLNNLIYAVCVLFIMVFSIIQGILIISAKTGFLSQSPLALGNFIMVVKQIMLLLVTRLFILFFNRHTAGELKKFEIVNFTLIPVFSIVFLGTLIAFASTIYLSLFDAALFVVNMVLVVILNIYFSYVYDAVSRKNELESEFRLHEQQAQSQYKYYKMLEDKQENYRKVIHDMRNHLITVEQMYKEGNGGAEEYMEDMHKLLNTLGQTYYTGNRELNIILNDKAEFAKSLNIDMEFNIGEVDLSTIKAIDQTTIFANLLDNALEALQRKVPGGEINGKVVRVNIEQIRGFIVIKVQNPSVRPKRLGTDFLSSKTGKKGIGLENVKKAVNKYDGTLVADWNDGWFEVSVTLPNMNGVVNRG